MILTKVGNSILKFIEFIKKLLIKQVIMFKKKKHFDTFNYFYSKKSSNRGTYITQFATMTLVGISLQSPQSATTPS